MLTTTKAGQAPQRNRIAQANAVDITTPCGSCPEPWTSGRNSSTTSSTAVIASGAPAWVRLLLPTCLIAIASSPQPSSTEGHQKAANSDGRTNDGRRPASELCSPDTPALSAAGRQK